MNLDTILATTKVVENNTLARHWTIRGVQFMSVHPFLGEVVSTLRDLSDYIAEAIGRKGDFSVRSMSGYMSLSEIKEELTVQEAPAMLQAESVELKVIISAIYEMIEDKVFSPSLESAMTAYSDKLEQHAWWIDQTIKSWLPIK